MGTYIKSYTMQKNTLYLKVLTTSTCNSFLKWPYHLVIASITYWWMCNCFPILFFLWRCSYVTRPRPIYLIFFLQSCHGFCYIFDISFLFYNFSFSCLFLLILSSQVQQSIICFSINTQQHLSDWSELRN